MTDDTMPRFRVYLEPATHDVVWWADTDAVPGLTVVADTLRELRALIDEAAAAHLGTTEVALDLIVEEDEPENLPAVPDEPKDTLPRGSEVRSASHLTPTIAA